MRVQQYDLFPTILRRYDIRDQISQDDAEAMIKDIDDIHQNHPDLMESDSLAVPFQSLPILFNERYDYIVKPHWHKLAATFVACCQDYNQTVKDYSNLQDSVQLTGIRGWFYKSCRTVWKNQPSSPAHNHRPSYLTGVFYLHIPGDLSTGGTEFCDPRGSAVRNTRNIHLYPINFTWVIFPGWMDHISGRVDSDEWRYTVAADCFMRLP